MSLVHSIREKENYKFLEILEADTIKQVVMNEEIRKIISYEQ